MNKAKIIFMAICGLVALIIFSPSNDSNTTQDDTETQSEHQTEEKLKTGETGIINRFEDKTKCELVTALAINKEDHNELLTTIETGDNIGLATMILDGKVFVVDNCTQAKVIDRAMFLRKVRILEGEQLGQAGWLPVEWIRSIE